MAIFSTMHYDIPDSLLEFAKHFAPKIVPQKRTAGWQETQTETRGYGDLSDMLGSLAVFDLLTAAKKVCKLDVTCGTSDASDVVVRVKNEFKNINVKTSSYAPFRSGLNLYVKAEELDKEIDAYLQCFVHLNEPGYAPHVHIAGWIPTTSKAWEGYKADLITIPNTGGHKGIKIPLEKLGSFDSFLKIIDEKF